MQQTTSSTDHAAPRLLVIDDEPKVRRSLARMLARQGFEVLQAGSGPEGLDLARSHDVHVALVDVRMPGMDGRDVIRRLRNLSPETEVIAVTAYGAADVAFEVLRDGATDYFEKPITDWQRFYQVIRKALEIRELKMERTRLAHGQVDPAFHRLIGNSRAMRELSALVRQVATHPVPVLIVGESGSGKERVARALHAASKRRRGPWVAINCATIPAGLIESELFGYEKGSHSTASQRKIGLFELADGGTLFLDEIGDMPIEMQAKLLRALQEREITRVGGTRPIPINARIISATNIDLKEAIAERRFREDLYYRLKVVEIRVPPLRERRSDIPLLAYYFIQKYNAEFEKRVRGIHPAAMRALQAYDWAENNVRELESAIQRAMVLCEGDQLTLDHFDLPTSPDSVAAPDAAASSADTMHLDEGVFDLPYQAAKNHVLTGFSVEYLKRRLRQTGGNITRAAELSGMQRPNFRKLMKRFGVENEVIEQHLKA